MIDNKKTRFGLVGAGAIAQTYAHAFPQTSKAELVAVADVRQEAAEAIGHMLGCPSFTSHEDMVESVPCDAVVVCTPPVTHPDICTWFLERGIHVLCEKPLAIDVDGASRMLGAAAKHGTRLTMASKFRYVEDVIKAKALVTSGILGEIVLFENTFTSHVDMSARWNSDPDVSGGGVLIDNGTHSVDIMRYFLGPLVELQVVEGKRVQGLPVEDTVQMFVRTAQGVRGSIDLSWSVNKEQPSFISVYGSRGTVLVGWRESKYRRSSDDEWIVFGSGYNKLQAFRDQLDNFAKALRNEETLLITADDALASVEVIEAAYEALLRATWQPVGDSPKGSGAAVSAGNLA